MDPDLHALIHDLLGTWSGTMTSPDGASTTLNLTAMNDEHGDLTLKPASSQSKAVGAARDVVVDGHTLRWTQALSGKSCTASATVAEGTNHAAETVKGTMVCPEREWNFVLAKTR